jgi:Zn-dependent protease
MDFFDGLPLPLRLLFGYLPMVLSLALHEYGHAASATALGDPTPREQGRLTLNPLAHIDLVGTVLLPIALIAMNQPVFGWAKPVGVSPYRFTRSLRMSTGLMLTAAAGPAMNLLIALASAVVLHSVARGSSPLVVLAAGQMMALNILLFLFNLLPVPPLDGSRVLGGLLPNPLRRLYGAAEGLSPLLLGLLFFTGLGGRLLSGPGHWLAGVVDAFGRALAVGPA